MIYLINSPDKKKDYTWVGLRKVALGVNVGKITGVEPIFRKLTFSVFANNLWSSDDSKLKYSYNDLMNTSLSTRYFGVGLKVDM